MVVVVEWQPQVLMSSYLQTALCRDHFLVGLTNQNKLDGLSIKRAIANILVRLLQLWCSAQLQQQQQQQLLFIEDGALISHQFFLLQLDSFLWITNSIFQSQIFNDKK
jgi:hypothetical protein